MHSVLSADFPDPTAEMADYIAFLRGHAPALSATESLSLFVPASQVSSHSGFTFVARITSATYSQGIALLPDYSYFPHEPNILYPEAFFGAYVVQIGEYRINGQLSQQNRQFVYPTTLRDDLLEVNYDSWDGDQLEFDSFKDALPPPESTSITSGTDILTTTWLDEYYLVIDASPTRPDYSGGLTTNPDYIGRFLVTVGNPTGQRDAKWGTWLDSIFTGVDYPDNPPPPPPEPPPGPDPGTLPPGWIEGVNILNVVQSGRFSVDANSRTFRDTLGNVSEEIKATAREGLNDAGEAVIQRGIERFFQTLGVAQEAIDRYQRYLESARDIDGTVKKVIARLFEDLSFAVVNRDQAAINRLDGTGTQTKQDFDDLAHRQLEREGVEVEVPDVQGYSWEDLKTDLKERFSELVVGTIFGDDDDNNGGGRPAFGAAAPVYTAGDIKYIVGGRNIVVGGSNPALIYGSILSDEFVGSAAGDILLGLHGSDLLSGAAGDDILSGGYDADSLAGGSGFDVASYASARPGYDVRTALSAGGLQTFVIDKAGPNGSDTLTAIEELQFTGRAFPLNGAQQNRTSNVSGSRFDDVLLQHAGSGQVYYAKMVDGVFQTWGINTGVLGDDWKAIASGDVNPGLTGGAETFVQQLSTGTVYYASLDTGATTWGVVSSSLTPDWVLRAVADINGDASVDAIIQDKTNGTIYFADMRGGAFSGWGVVNQSLTKDWIAVGAGDLNADGFADVVIQEQATGTTYYANMRGGAFSGWGVVSANLTKDWHVKAVADVNGDGFADVVFQNLTGAGGVNPGTAYYADLRTGVVQWGVVTASVTGDWEVQGAADVDNDGFGDVLLQNRTDGTTFYANMGSAGFEGWGVVAANISKDWEVIGPHQPAPGSVDPNDSPVIIGASVDTRIFMAPVGNPGDAFVLASDNVAFSDADGAQPHTVRAIHQSNAGPPLGLFTHQLLNDTSGSGGGGLVHWEYQVAPSVVNSLPAGTVRVDDFIMTIDDGFGGTVTKQIAIQTHGPPLPPFAPLPIDVPISPAGNELQAAGAQDWYVA